MLGRRQRRYILDVQPAPSALGAYKDLVVRLHIPLSLDTVSDRVRVATLDPDALDKYLRDNPGAIAHGRTHDGLMLTADSPAVARFLSMYLQRPGVLTSPSTWTRRAER